MADLWLEPYEEAIAEFPVTGPDRERLEAALRFAVRAPSVHNTQPWRCAIGQGRLVVDADPGRQLTVSDPDGREMYISCGALVEHLWVVLRRFGYEPEIVAFPEGGAGPVAWVAMGAPRRVDPLDRRLFDAALRRRTNRRPFRRKAVPELALERASRRALQRRARFQVLGEASDRALIADLVSEADRLQMNDPAFRRELARWLRSVGSSAVDGIPASAGKAPAILRATAPLLVRTFDVGEGVAAIDRRLAAGSPVLAVLWTPADDRGAWFDAGRALARVLLSLTADGLSASFLNQAVEVATVRARLDGAMGHGARAQCVLRVGFGSVVPPTPRRPLESVLMTPGNSKQGGTR